MNAVRSGSSNGHDRPVRVGIAGLGRSGWNIHARTLAELPEQFRVVAVADAVDERLDEARQRFGCRTCKTFDALLDDEQVELVVIATPNRLHTEHALAAFEAGKHVVCEKPMALSTDDADRALTAAERAGLVLAPFQNRRYEAHFRQVQQVIDSGVLGRIVQIRMTWHAFTRRWDWQSLREFGGGLLNNNGSHLIDQAVQLFGDTQPKVFADLQLALSCGDAEDHVKVILHGAGRPTIDVELTNACAFAQDRWLVMGTAGGLCGTTEQLEWRWVDWSMMPKRSVERLAAPDRKYNRDELTWRHATWTKPSDWPGEYKLFYDDLYATLRHGKALTITPASVRRQIAVLEACHAQQAYAEREANAAPAATRMPEHAGPNGRNEADEYATGLHGFQQASGGSAAG